MTRIIKIRLPDGREIAVGNDLLATCTRDDTACSMPEAPPGFINVGISHLESATNAEQREKAERLGSALGTALLHDLIVLRGRPQVENLRAVRAKFLALYQLEDADSAAEGFATTLANVLELGVKNLPRIDGESFMTVAINRLLLSLWCASPSRWFRRGRTSK